MTNRRPGDQEDERREPERERRHHAEREVDRRADRAVGGREQARGAQPPLDRHERVPARPRPRHRPFARKACSSGAIKAAASPGPTSARQAGAGARGSPERSALTQRPRGRRVDDHPAGALAEHDLERLAQHLAGGPAGRHRHHDRVRAGRRSPRARSGGRPRPGAPSRRGPRTRWPRPAHWRAASITACAVASASGSGASMSRCCGTVIVTITRRSPPLCEASLSAVAIASSE